MNRRFFIAASSTALFAPTFVKAAYSPVEFLPDEWRALRKQNKIALLNFNADWSMTCQMKRAALERLVGATPVYAERITFVDVDWDTYAFAEWTKAMKVERRSTLVVMKGRREVARLVAQPDEGQIKGLLDTALNAALR